MVGVPGAGVGRDAHGRARGPGRVEDEAFNVGARAAVRRLEEEPAAVADLVERQRDPQVAAARRGGAWRAGAMMPP
jgi:hypothetical protein